MPICLLLLTYWTCSCHNYSFLKSPLPSSSITKELTQKLQNLDIKCHGIFLGCGNYGTIQHWSRDREKENRWSQWILMASWTKTVACTPLPSIVRFLYWDIMEFLWLIYHHPLSITNYPNNCWAFVWKYKCPGILSECAKDSVPSPRIN